MTVRTYSVPGISCAACQRAIEGEVGALTDVTWVSVDVATKTVRVEGEASDDAVRAAIDDAGYEIAATIG